MFQDSNWRSGFPGGKVFTDIRFWLLAFFLIRLISIDLPPLDEHSWRQSITLGVAKSYLELDACFFEPKTVICDSREGILAQEFPLMNYLIFLLWKVFGMHNWVFRLLNLSVCTLGLYYFYQLIFRLFDRETAFASTVLFAVSVAFIYARKAMPDVFAVSLCLIGLEYGYRYVQAHRPKDLLLFGLLLTLGLLSKMPAAVVLPLGFYLLSFQKGALRNNLPILAAGGVSVGLMALWYFVWVPWAEQTYQFPLFYPTSFQEGLTQLSAMKTELRERFYPIALTSKLAFLAFLAGFAAAIYRRNKKMLALLLMSSFVLVFFMLKTGGTFAGHAYYIVPFVPMMSLLAGYGLAQLSRHKALFYGLLLLISTEAIYRHSYDFFIPEQDKKYLKLAAITDQRIPKESRILVNEGVGQPRMMYFANRRGWTVDDRMQDAQWIREESSVGLAYMILLKSKWQDTLPYPVLYDDVDFRVYQVKED